MLKIKNKFIIFIIALLVLIISFWILKSYFDYKSGNDSFALLINWEATINNGKLPLNTKTKLYLWDNIKTIGEDTFLVLEWWDGSMTRLWWNTSVKIEELYVSNNNWIINISFSLLNWKTWSNIVSFLWEWSHFKEFFRDNEAAVRWTIFNVDLDNNYLNVIDHKVTLTKIDWEKLVINENKILDISNFSFLSLEDFIKLFRNFDWEKSNKLIDKEIYAWLKEQLYKDLEDINKFKDIDLENIISNVNAKKDLYNELLQDYQKLNFIKSDDEKLFKTKLELKATLIKLANEENKNKLIENTLYDFKDLIYLEEFWNLDFILEILWDNKELLSKFNLKDYIDIEKIPDSIQNSIFNDLNIFQNTLWDNLPKINDAVNDTADNTRNDIFGDLNTLWDNLPKINDAVNDNLNNAIDSSLDDINNVVGSIGDLFNK